ncbi:OpgC domain-containing protein [Bradyrhizobium sp.]|uniref:OpgC domain-containing protein n=1 Tax=Bradyrhizobium sp. TaxID=376 RepID=UPI0027346CEA|nr:OpgC domain-containing protein [Bradyrhizobium sp.]MDP3076284.1 OpgC domain-containing protein [Bradyrhizobium sp.]
MTSIADRFAGAPYTGEAKARAAAAAPVAVPVITLPAGTERELRLDLFRGLALWLIFIGHLPNNIVTWFTFRNYGFSDATEIFIFISGYTAAFVYGRAMLEAGFVIATARIMRRVWQIYVAHVFLFVIFLAQIFYVAARFDNPLYAEEMGIMDFLKQPDVAIIQALLLRFRPANMDVLPLYIVLMLFLPLIIWLMKWRPDVTLALSVVLYAVSWQFDLYLSAYPNGFWVFNPFAWQLLFVFGAWCALGGARRMSRILSSPVTMWLCGAYLLFAFCVTLTWHLPQLNFLMPKRIEQWMYPITKTDMDVLRFAHFLALAAVTVRLLPKDWPGLKSRWLRPMILCGQHSLEIFCLGVFLAFAGHFVLAEFAGGGRVLQLVVSVAGILIMVGVAWIISWYKHSADKNASRKKGAVGNADMAGGGS